VSAEVLLIDLSNLFWSAWHATRDSAQSEARSLTEAAIRRCVGELDGKLVAICCDKGRSFRKTLAPEYKANRPEKDQAAIAELERVKDTLRDQGYWLAAADGFEADDVIATLAHQASKAGHPIRICSADKDLLQLLALPDSSALRTYNDWPTMRAADVVTKLGVDPEGLRDWLALVGDKGDNVEGARGVGPVTATKLLLDHYDLDTLYAKLDLLAGGAPILPTKTPEAKTIATPAVLQSLWDNRAKVMLARELVTLRTDAPVNFADIFERREPKKRERIQMEDEPTVESISAPPSREQDIPSPPEAGRQATSAPIVATGGARGGEAPIIPKEQGAVAVPGADVQTQSVDAPAAQSRALVVAEGVTYERQLEPRTPVQAVQLGQILYDSRAFVRFPTAESLTACVLGGRELGLGAIASTNAFHYMAEMGCLALKAHTIGELGMRHPKCRYLRLLHSDDTYAEYEGWHVDHPAPYKHRFSIQDAVNAGLATLEMKPREAMDKKDTRGQWDKRRKEMLRARCLTQIVRIMWPGASMGFYSIDELGGEE
jgi:5'-3' exonuclease